MDIGEVSLLFDPVAAAEVAAAHQEAPRVGGPLAHAAYDRLVSESDHLFTLITQARPPTAGPLLTVHNAVSRRGRAHYVDHPRSLLGSHGSRLRT